MPKKTSTLPDCTPRKGFPLTLHQSLNLANLFFIAFLVNVPLGYLRESATRYSFRWFLFIHLSIPFILLARLGYGFSWQIVPFTIASAIAGQILGGRIKRGRQ